METMCKFPHFLEIVLLLLDVKSHDVGKLAIDLDNMLADPTFGNFDADTLEANYKGKYLIMLIVVFPLKDVLANVDPHMSLVKAQPRHSKSIGAQAK